MFQKNKSLFAWMIWFVLVGLLLGSGFLILVLFALPFEQARQIANLLSKDGSLDVFTGELYQRGKILLGLGVVCLVGVGGMVIQRHGVHQWIVAQLQNGGKALAILFSDARMIGRELCDALANRLELGILLGIIALAIANRTVYLSKPMGHDEAYTVMAFAIRPLRYLIADYHLPNNHVFHTILVHTSLMLGKQPWIVRLPAFLSGVLLVPVSYLAGRQIFKSKWAGLLSATLVCVVPELISFSTNARGYTLICLFTLIVLLTGNYVRQHPNLAGWGMLALCSALGFYTMPIMVYPVGMVYTWLLLSAWAGDISESYSGTRSFLKHLFFSAFSGALVTLALYTPVFIVSGANSLLNNSFVKPLSWSGFVAGLPIHLGKTWQEWGNGIPDFFIGVSVVCFLVAMSFHKKLTRQVIPFPVVAFGWVATLVYVQRVAPVSRIWLFALPLYLIYVAAGWNFALNKFLSRIQNAQRWSSSMYGVGILIVALWSFSGAIDQFREIREQPLGRVEQLTLSLCSTLHPQDVVLVDATHAPSFWYYFYLYGMTDEYFPSEENTQTYRQIYVIVDEGEHETFESVVERQRFKDIIEPSTVQILMNKGPLTLFQAQPKLAYRISNASENSLRENTCP